jgi:hypothetical protein
MKVLASFRGITLNVKAFGVMFACSEDRIE